MPAVLQRGPAQGSEESRTEGYGRPGEQTASQAEGAQQLGSNEASGRFLQEPSRILRSGSSSRAVCLCCMTLERNCHLDIDPLDIRWSAA